MNNLTPREVNLMNRITTRTKEVGLGTKLYEIIALLNSTAPKGITPGTPVNAVAAHTTLTISGPVFDGETVVIGDDIYEFVANANGEASNPLYFPVDIFEYTTQSTGTLKVDTQPTAGDTMTIGGKEYIFVPDGTANADGEISIGTDIDTAQANIVAAINGAEGSYNTPNAKVSIGNFDAETDTAIITALVGGVAGNLIETTSNFTAVSNMFGTSTLDDGSNCIASNAVLALTAAINEYDTMGVTADDKTVNTVLITSDVAGEQGNLIEISENMTNGAFPVGTTTLEGGINGTVGSRLDMMMDPSYFYICTDTNTINDKNWRRISLDAEF